MWPRIHESSGQQGSQVLLVLLLPSQHSWCPRTAAAIPQSTSFKGKAPFPFAKASPPLSSCSGLLLLPMESLPRDPGCPFASFCVYKKTFSYEIPLPLIPREITNDYTCFGVNTKSSPPISPVQSRPVMWNTAKTLWQNRGPA